MRILLCMLMIFFVAMLSGCSGSAVKGAAKGAGKFFSRTAKTTVKVADKVDTALDVAEVVMDSRTPGNNSHNSSTPSARTGNSAPTARTGSVRKAGMVAAGGALIAGELMDEGLNAGDLSLGALTIDDRAEKVTSEYGNPSSVKTDSDGAKRMTYKDVEVVVRDGKISALVSQSSALTTARGIHEGSSAQEVFDKYGTDYSKTTVGDRTLYEYAITSSDGHPCWLRFAVNPNGKVAYISERFVQSESSSNSVENEGAARQAFINYHKAITNGNYREAYETLSYAQRDQMGSFDSYVSGFATTISSKVSELNLVSSDGDSYTFDYTLTARDRDGGRVKVAIFQGQVTMAKDKGRWFVRNAKSSKVSEHYE